jgi:hypothetical protein
MEGCESEFNACCKDFKLFFQASKKMLNQLKKSPNEVSGIGKDDMRKVKIDATGARECIKAAKPFQM